MVKNSVQEIKKDYDDIKNVMQSLAQTNSSIMQEFQQWNRSNSHLQWENIFPCLIDPLYIYIYLAAKMILKLLLDLALRKTVDPWFLKQKGSLVALFFEVKLYVCHEQKII